MKHQTMLTSIGSTNRYGSPHTLIHLFSLLTNLIFRQVNICLECGASQLRQLKRRFLRCSSQATVTHLKKFIALKVLNSIDAYRDVDILCNDELLGKDHTLKYVMLTRWRFKEPPLKLIYRPRMDLM